MGHIFLNPLTESAHIMVSTMVWVGGIIRPLFPLGSRGWACSGAFLRYFSGQELAPPLTGAATAFIRCDGRGRLEDNWKRSRKGVGGGRGEVYNIWLELASISSSCVACMLCIPCVFRCICQVSSLAICPDNGDINLLIGRLIQCDFPLLARQSHRSLIKRCTRKTP